MTKHVIKRQETVGVSLAAANGAFAAATFFLNDKEYNLADLNTELGALKAGDYVIGIRKEDRDSVNYTITRIA